MVMARAKLSVIQGKLGSNQASNESLPEGTERQKTSCSMEQSQYVETLYRKYHSSLLSYLMRIVPGGRRQDANEILQETYLRLLKQDSLDHLEQNARAYIFTIATNLVCDSRRRRASRMQDLHIELDEISHASDEPSPPRVTDWGISAQRIKEALFELNPTTRKIFILSRFEQMTYPEIASALDISTRTVERHMSNAIRQLQKALEDLI